jgi:hypothetical protein
MGHLVDEVETLHRRFGACAFNLVDDDFLGPWEGALERVRSLAVAVERWRLPVSFGVQLRPQSLSAEVVDALAAARVAYAFIGVESDDHSDLRRWNRAPAPSVWDWIGLLRGKGIEVGVGALVFHPGATLESVAGFTDRLAAAGALNYRTATNRLDAIPGSRIHALAVQRGQVHPDAIGPSTLPFETPGMEGLYEDVLRSLAPLGPPSMHAACRLPELCSRRHRGTAESLGLVRDCLARLDGEVGRIVRAVLGLHREEPALRGGPSPHGGKVAALREGALVAAMDAARRMVQAGILGSMESMREAIRIDAGP